MGIFISIISKRKEPVKTMIMQKLNSGELETNLNTDFDDLSVYFNNSDTIGIVNFITENLIYKAEQTYTPPPRI